MQRVGEMCGGFLEPIHCGAIGRLLGRLHDFGKLSPLFREVLSGERQHVDHAFSGAAMLCALLRGQDPMLKRVLAPVIAGHHGSLSDYAVISDELEQVMSADGEMQNAEGEDISLVGKRAFTEAYQYWRRFFSYEKLERVPCFDESTEARKLDEMLFVRFLYSALIDADWSSSAEHDDPAYMAVHSAGALKADEVSARLGALLESKRSASCASRSLNALRDALFKDCIRAAEAEPGLFTLTAPTGLGKTLSLFAFALRHCSKWGKRRIVLVLPYLSLIEQNSRDYRVLVPELLEMHSGVLQTEATAAIAERWDAPCIVTTNVGFFEPLFSNRPGDCRHLHLLSDSVIVLDEAQALPAHLLESTLQSVRLLCERYGCSFVFSTATQPSFRYLKGLHGKWMPREIVPDPQALFNKTERVIWDWRTERRIPPEAVAKELSLCKQACVIVNLKRHARELYRTLAEMRSEEVFCLTTDLCPAHRSDVLQEVRRRLQSGQPCLLVSTQCIEAGVDLDFPILWRALAPLESLIQSAGRCNRNGDAPNGRVTVFRLQTEGQMYPDPEYERAANCVLNLLERHPINCNDLSHIDEYYRLLYTGGNGDSEKLTRAIGARDYRGAAEAYRLIERENSVHVIVPYGGKQELFLQLRERLDAQGMTRELLRAAAEISVTSHRRDAVMRIAEPVYLRIGRETAETGFYLLGSSENYDGGLGLCFDAKFDGIL